MKKTNKITLSAIMAALAMAFMLVSYFPYLTYAIPAIAGLFIMITVIENGCKWALGAYLSSAVLVFLTAEPESGIMYVAFFGYYPIIKALLERIRKPFIEWPVKIIIFNGAVLLVYMVLAKAMNIDMEGMGTFMKYGTAVLLAAGNVVFVVYDIAVSRMASVYISVVRPKLKRFLK